LAAEHKKIEEHRKWMYDADPFQAKKIVEERQAQRSQQASTSSAADPKVHKSSGQIPSNYPEVIMATSLRELVEDAIKQVGFLILIFESILKGETTRE
jgi:ATP-dependent RNA helicase DHX57